MLRWFPPDDIGYPDFGFDIYRAYVGDVLPFSFYDATIANLIGKQRVLVDDRVELETTDPAGLAFQSYGPANALLVSAASRLTIGFPGRAWDLSLGAAMLGTGMRVEAFAAGISRGTQLLVPGQQANWRTRGLDRVELTGDGGIALIGYRLVDGPYQWTHLGHRSLPVSDPAYPDPAKPAPGSEADEARSRLPADVAADWAVGYGPSFPDLLTTLPTLALHQPAPRLPVPPAPDQPRLSADGAELLRAALIAPHVGRIVGLAWDDGQAIALSQLLPYKVVGRWRGGSFAAHAGDKVLAALGPEVFHNGRAVAVQGRTRSVDADLGGGIFVIRLGAVVEELVIELRTTCPLEVIAFDVGGTELDCVPVARSDRTAVLQIAGIARIELHGTGPVSVSGFRWRGVPGAVRADPRHQPDRPQPARRTGVAHRPAIGASRATVCVRARSCSRGETREFAGVAGLSHGNAVLWSAQREADGSCRRRKGAIVRAAREGARRWRSI